MQNVMLTGDLDQAPVDPAMVPRCWSLLLRRGATAGGGRAALRVCRHRPFLLPSRAAASAGRGASSAGPLSSSDFERLLLGERTAAAAAGPPTAAELRARYRALALEMHPDTNRAGLPAADASARFVEVLVVRRLSSVVVVVSRAVVCVAAAPRRLARSFPSIHISASLPKIVESRSRVLRDTSTRRRDKRAFGSPDTAAPAPPPQ